MLDCCSESRQRLQREPERCDSLSTTNVTQLQRMGMWTSGGSRLISSNELIHDRWAAKRFAERFLSTGLGLCGTARIQLPGKNIQEAKQLSNESYELLSIFDNYDVDWIVVCARIAYQTNFFYPFNKGRVQ